LHKHEKNYPAYKKELLAIVFALMKFHQYLWGRRFVLYTDHRPLTYIHEQKELPQIISNWRDTIFNYDFECIYRPGILNVIPDALSRAYPDDLWTNNTLESGGSGNPKMLKEIAAATITEIDYHEVEETDSDIVMETISEEEKKHEEEVEKRLAKIIVPIGTPFVHQIQSEDQERELVTDADKQNELMQIVHEFGHLGANAMVKEIHNRGQTWPKLKEACLKWVSQCGPCQHFNIARKGYHPLKAIHARLPGEHVAIDLATFDTSTEGNTFALVMVDICTRFVFLEALPNKEAKTVAKALFKIFCTIGFPKIIQSDNGTEFVNEVSKLMNETLKIEHRLSTPYHPRSNGVAERFVRSLKETIRKQLQGRNETWDRYLPLTQLQLNVRVASLHSSTPFSLFYGRSFAGLTDFQSTESHLLTEEELEKRLEYLTNLVFPAISEKSRETQKKMIEKFKRTHKLHDFFPGSFVMAREELPDGKLAPKYRGPYKVARRTPHGSYELLDAMNTPLGRRYSPEQLKKVTQALDAPSDESYEVEKIIKHYDSPGGVQYLVKWKNYDNSWNEVLEYEHFDSDKLIRQYWKKKRKEFPHKEKANTTKPNQKTTKATSQRQQKRKAAVEMEEPKDRTKRTRVTRSSRNN
jgi:transposase InsO family protein